MRLRLPPWVGHLARLGLSLSLVGGLLISVDFQQLMTSLRGADWALYGLGLTVSTSGMLLRAWRWRVMLQASGARVSFRRLLYLDYVGAFFNTFLPTGLGGDVIRWLEIGPGATKPQAAGTILIERLTGFLVLFGLLLAVLPFAAARLPPALVLMLLALALGVLAAGGLLLEGRWLRRGMAHLPRVISLAGDTWLGQMYAVIVMCGRRAIGLGLGISLAFNGVLIVSHWLLARALGLALPLWAVAMALPILAAALLVPVSINGFGVREGLMVLLLGQLGVDGAHALALALAWYTIDLWDGLLGGGLYLLTGLLGLRGRPAPELADENAPGAPIP